MKSPKVYIIAGVILLLILIPGRKMAAAAAEAIIKKFEADNNVKRYLTAYQDSAGVWTIGWGSIWHYDLKRRVQPGDRITEEKATEWMKKEISSLQNKIKPFVKVPLNSNEEAAVISLSYNIGPGAFRDSTLLKLLNSGAPRTQVADQFLRWDKITDPVTKKKVSLPGLQRRRQAEKALFLLPVA
jgi:lysozyme